MRILYISDRQDGGILRHVKCLRECLPSEVECYEIGHGGTEEFAGRNGHDIREWFQIRRIIGEFNPDIVHFHIPALMMMLYVRLFSKAKIIRSWHTIPFGSEGIKDRVVRWIMGKSSCYYLPVSTPTWDGLRKWIPDITGEIFYNSIQIKRMTVPDVPRGWKGKCPVVGMVGRRADVKDWPSFHEVERLVKEQIPMAVFVNGGEDAPCDGRKAIAEMDLFLMTSKNEALPTTMLECFLLGTPICGFLPVGGTCDVLGFSNGAVRDAFSKERDCRKLAAMVVRLLNDETQRRRMVEDGWQILKNHFAAETLVNGQLMEIYRKVIG